MLAHEINRYEALLTRVEEAQIEGMMEHSRAPNQPAQWPLASGSLAHERIAAEITIDEFAKVDLRIAKIVAAEYVHGADKLLRLRLDIGDQQRTVLAAIKSAYKPEDLEGRLTVMVANLAARKMKFGVSEGMLLAAGPDGQDIFIVSPDEGAVAGLRVK